MKRLILSAVLCIACITAFSQSYTRNGKEFSPVKKERTSSSGGKKTGYTWKDSKGNVYDIYISDRGSCYIIKVSRKTGEEYKHYLPKDVQKEIRNEMKKL